MPPLTIREAARAANAAGICVLPAAEDGSKRPGVPSWREYQEQRPTNAELNTWFPPEGGKQGLGFVCGKVSGGLELFEFDDADAVVEFKQLAQAAGLYPLVLRIELGYVEETPGGGVHWLYRVPEPNPNTKLASRPCPGAPDCEKHVAGQAHVLIETRGEGGWVVVAPSSGSVHPSGKPYRLAAGGVDQVATLLTEERDELWALARVLDAMPRPEASSAPAAGAQGGAGDRPGDLYGQQVAWRDILEPHGWRFVFRRGDEEYWRRPGKERGFSATTNYHGSDLLYVFSTSVPEFVPEEGYSKFRAYALLAHGGDFAAAARELKAQGYAGYDPGPLVAAGGGVTSAPSRNQAGELVDGLPVAADGPGPVTRDPEYCFRSVFPEGHFVERYVAYASQLTDAAHEYHETLGVMLLSACTPGVRARLSAWPSGLATNLYAVLVGSSTRSRKSTAISIMKRVLERVDEMAVFPDRFSAQAMLEQVAMRAKKPSIWFPDEWGKVIDTLPQNPLLEDALLTLYDSPRMYDYARHSKRVKGGTQVEDHDRVQDPHWAVVGATTEAVFDSLSSRAVESGFLPRFAYVFPERLPPRMGLQASSPDMEAAQRSIVTYLRDLYTWSQLRYGEVQVTFAPVAIELLDAYLADVEDANDTMLARLPPMAIKVAMLSALGEGVPGVAQLVIEERDALVGVRMARRWGESATRFSHEVGGFDPHERRFQQRCHKALAFVRTGPDRRRALAEVSRLLRIKAEDVLAIGRALESEGSIRIEAGKSSGGRPPVFWVAL